MAHRRALIVIASAMILMILPSAPGEAGEGAAAKAFEALKGLEGTWHGKASMDQSDATLVFEVSAAGTVVMETMFPGTDHEMINMYHLDGDDLVLTHYCAGGNQPTMKLVEAEGEELHFDFTGGTNLDPANDPHIHAAVLELGDETLKASWTAWQGGKAVGENVLEVERAGD